MTRLAGICFATSSRILPAGPAREDATIASGFSAFAAVTNGAKSTSVARYGISFATVTPFALNASLKIARSSSSNLPSP